MRLILLLFISFSCSLHFAQDYEKANLHFENGNYPAAAKEYEKVIPWLEKELGKKDTTSIPIYKYLLGASYYYSQQNDKALKSIDDAIEFCQKNCKGVNEYEIYSREIRAAILAGNGQINELINERTELIALHKSKNYDKSELIKLAYAYNDLGIAYYTGAMDKYALEAYDNALENFNNSKDVPPVDVATIKLNKAYCYLYLNDFQQSSSLYKEAFAEIVKLHPKDYPAQMISFKQEGINLINSKEYKLAQQALVIDIEAKKNVISSNDTCLIESYIYLGQAYYYNQDNKEAKSSYDHATELIKLNYKKQEAELAFWLNYIAGMYDLIEEDSVALEHYESSIPYYKSIESTKPWGYIITVQNITRIANELKLYDKALEYAKLKFDFYDKNYSKNESSMYKGYMNSVLDLAILHIQTLNMNLAEEIILKAYAKDKNLSDIPEVHINFQDKLFEVYSNTGQYEKGHKLLDEELPFIEKHMGKDEFYYVTKVGRGLLYSQQGENLKALESFEDVYPFFKGKSDYNEANVLNNQAMILEELGDFKTAERKFLQALTIHHAIDTNTHHYLAALSNLGKLYFDQADYDKALSYYERSKIITERILGKVSQEYVSITNSMANAYLYSQRFETAVAYYQESIEYIEQVFTKDHPMVLDLLGNVGHSLCALQMFDDGIEILEKVHNKSEEVFGTSSYKTLHYKANLAMAYHSKNDDKKAKPQMLDLLKYIDQNVNYNLKYLNESASLAYIHKNSLYYSNIYSYLFDQRNSTDIVEAGFNSIIKNKGRLLESNTALKNQVAKSNNKKLIETYDQWIEKIKTLNNLQNSASKIDIEILNKTEEEVNQLEQALIKLSDDFAKKLGKSYSWQDVQSKLKDKEVLVEFIRIEHQQNFIKDSVIYGAFILSSSMEHPIFIPVCTEIDLTNILGQISSNNLSFVEKAYGTKGTKSGLHKILIQPLTPYLQDINKVYISPDGILHKVSFSAISDGQNSFGNTIDVFMLNSSSSLLEEAFEPTKNYNPLLIGGVEYSLEKDQDEIWKYLSGTKEEITELASLFENKAAKIQILTGTNATEAKINEVIGNTNIIHIATHGFFYPEPSLAAQEAIQETESVSEIAFRGGSRGAGYNYYVANNNPMMRSGIALSGANQVWNNPNISIEQDGILTALDFSLMNLQNVDLIVLSACETGLGDIKGSEGVYGLQRSLKLAGAKHLIMSLWQVPDKETKEFMITFYTHLLDSNNIEESFILTQKEMSKKYDPYYWGAFVLL